MAQERPGMPGNQIMRSMAEPRQPVRQRGERAAVQQAQGSIGEGLLEGYAESAYDFGEALGEATVDVLGHVAKSAEPALFGLGVEMGKAIGSGGRSLMIKRLLR